MSQMHEWMFYELMWRAKGRGAPIPLPWWTQQYFRHWVEPFDGGLFDSKEAAFASNASYRYWNMVGVKDAAQESLIGQAGEIEPVYDKYVVSFFLFDPATRRLCLPQRSEPGDALSQNYESGYVPAIITTYDTPLKVRVTEKVIATTVGPDQRSVVLARFNANLAGISSAHLWFCLAIVPAGPSGFQRHDKAGRYMADRRITYLKYLAAEQRVITGSGWGPVFDRAPAHFGLYGNGSSQSPDHYLANNPFTDLQNNGVLNGQTEASDNIAGLCSAVFAWPVDLVPAAPAFSLDIRLPVDDYRGAGDLADLKAADADTLESSNTAFWINKLDFTGLQMELPPVVGHLSKLHRICRANILMLADNGEIHPGPTIYDSFWVRDSSIEGMAAALVGDANLAERQFGTHYPAIFNTGYDRIGPVSVHGMFAGEHEKNDREWDCNGQALWALGRFDRVKGSAASFGHRLFSPYITDGARWIRDNRSPYGILHSGWSAEHIGDKGQPHYWDDFWGIAGLWEAAQLATRISAPEKDEIWWAYNDLVNATANSIRWVLGEQRKRGFWETFIPTGPGDVGRLDSTIIGAVAYFHPCRLYMGNKLGADIDAAARLTLETIWSHFIDGGFRHDSAWYCYGPYLTLQLAHAFLLIGDTQRMDQLLAWSVHSGMFAQVDRQGGDSSSQWGVALGAWNEQHCYPIASDFAEVPERWWYMGDIPHGWACAEFMLLLRDILFFESDEDGEPQIYIAPGVMPHWVKDNESIVVKNAPTVFGQEFGYRLTLHESTKQVDIQIFQPTLANVGFVYPCRFGSAVVSATVNGSAIAVSGRDVRLPKGTLQAIIKYT
ncbi:MAG: hypothetical protein WCI11_01165 [Candidatus Methylumidiphilus sp.]|nr:hypothetical protein [Pseudomonadota bacterium]